jgi:hypothetical protein
MDNKHYPNPETYRPWLGKAVNTALIELARHKNADALDALSVSDWLEKIVRHWWENEFPGKPFPASSPKRYDKDIDFVQSA